MMVRSVPSLSIAAIASRVLPAMAACAFSATGLPLEAATGDLPALTLDDRVSARDLALLAEHPRIAPWRAAYRAMGLRPSEFRSSIEQLVRRSLSGRAATGPTWLIERYNAHSIANLVPMGGYDLDNLRDAPIEIRVSAPSDAFAPLGGDGAKMVTGGNVLVYAQGVDILCWALNHRDAAATSLRPDTRRAVFISESVDDQGRADSVRALENLRAELVALGASCSQILPFVPRGDS